MTARAFVKRPVEIRAIQFTGDNVREIYQEFGADGIYGPTETNPDHLILTTIHGDPAPCRPGDWVVPEPVPGRFYPVQDSVFAASYRPREEVNDGQARFGVKSQTVEEIAYATYVWGMADLGDKWHRRPLFGEGCGYTVGTVSLDGMRTLLYRENPPAAPRRVFYDCEFIEDGTTIELISIGMVDTDGNEFYAVNRDAPWERIANHDWLRRNVVPSLPRLHGRRLDPRRHNPLDLDLDHPDMQSRRDIADGVRAFIGTDPVELWADYSAYDHVVLAQLWGPMISLPAGVPMFTHDLEQMWENAGRPERPVQKIEHNALADARWNRALHQVCDRAQHPGAIDQDDGADAPARATVTAE